eukprot:COSAG06_NODE_54307_length_295_cov_0.795918_2_plen_43_part_01
MVDLSTVATILIGKQGEATILSSWGFSIECRLVQLLAPTSLRF